MIKEQACFVAADFEAEKGGSGFTVELPDGKEVTVSGEFLCAAPELLFSPLKMSLGEMECKSIPEAAWGAIQAVEVDTRVDLTKNILVSGGNSLLTGFVDRLKADIVKLAPQDMDVRVTAAKDRKNAVW